MRLAVTHFGERKISFFSTLSTILEALFWGNVAAGVSVSQLKSVSGVRQKRRRSDGACTPWQSLSGVFLINSALPLCGGFCAAPLSCPPALSLYRNKWFRQTKSLLLSPQNLGEGAVPFSAAFGAQVMGSSGAVPAPGTSPRATSLFFISTARYRP